MRRTVHVVPQFLALLLCARDAFAQRLVDPAQLPETVKKFNPNKPQEPLPCAIERVQPTLNFDFRLQVGYVVRAPVTTSTGVAHRWILVLRVTPVGGSRPSVYFTDSVDFPIASRPDFVATVRGLFLVGAGNYDIAFSLLDDLGRVCRQKWTLSASLPQSDRASEAMLPPGAAADLSSLPPRSLSPNPSAQSRRITVILNVLPAASRFVRPGRPDGLRWLLTQWRALMSMLECLLEQIPADSVRIVGFSWPQQRELFREDNFTLLDINRIVHLGDVLERVSINDRLFQNPAGILNLLIDLGNRETHAEQPPDDVIFLGLPMASPKIAWGFPVRTTAATRFFYLQYRPRQPGLSAAMSDGSSFDNARTPSRPRLSSIPAQPEPRFGTPASPPDWVEGYMRLVKGHTLTIESLADFKKAYRLLPARLEKIFDHKPYEKTSKLYLQYRQSLARLAPRTRAS